MKSLFDPKYYLPVINGLVGDKLAETNHEWAIPFRFRIHGKDVLVSELDSQLSGKPLAIFVHGLMADERMWKHFAQVEKDQAILYVRYNTGLHISENGRALSQLLHELQTRFKPESLSLAGHSMGGLVIRSACHQAVLESFPWVRKVKLVFLIAVPNAGAALEQFSHVTTLILKRIARWHLGTIGEFIDGRSNGIKDLRLGAMLENDWKHPHTERISVRPIPGIHYHVLVGSLSKNEKTLMAKYFGDGLVSQHSAVATTLLKVSTVRVFPNTGHNSILRSPRVVRYVRKLLRG